MNAIIVGTSTTLLAHENGNKIDSFDFVARSVSELPYTGFEKYIGTKVNLFWSKYQYLFRLKHLQKPFNGSLLILNPDPDNYTEDYIPENARISKYNRIMYDKWYEEFSKKYANIDIIHYGNRDLNELHKRAYFKAIPCTPTIYSSAGLRVIDYFIKHTCFEKIYVTGFSFFDKGTYFDPIESYLVREHCPYKEKFYYDKLIEHEIIYEL